MGESVFLGGPGFCGQLCSEKDVRLLTWPREYGGLEVISDRTRTTAVFSERRRVIKMWAPLTPLYGMGRRRGKPWEGKCFITCMCHAWKDRRFGGKGQSPCVRAMPSNFVGLEDVICGGWQWTTRQEISQELSYKRLCVPPSEAGILSPGKSEGREHPSWRLS